MFISKYKTVFKSSLLHISTELQCEQHWHKPKFYNFIMDPEHFRIKFQL